MLREDSFNGYAIRLILADPCSELFLELQKTFLQRVIAGSLDYSHANQLKWRSGQAFNNPNAAARKAWVDTQNSQRCSAHNFKAYVRVRKELGKARHNFVRDIEVAVYILHII